MSPMVFYDATNGRALAFQPRRLVVAGYTGRDRNHVRAHIDELAAQGITAPASTPAFYEIPIGLLTQRSELRVTSVETSGEVEPVLLCTNAGWYLGVGSDHTARDIERESVARSKASCGKPVGSWVFPLSHVVERWDAIRVRSRADTIGYQEASLSILLPAAEIVAAYQNRPAADADDVAGLVMFLGTVPISDGKFVYSTLFDAELISPDGQQIACSYKVVPG